MPLRLMTYNIRLGLQQGLQAIADVISTHQPDLIALQEVGDHWTMGPEGDSTSTLADMVARSNHLHIPCITETDERGHTHRYGHALICAHPIETLRTIELPQNIDEPRRILHARVQHPDTPFQLLTTHLSHKPEDRQQHGPILANLFLELAAESDEPCFLLGDLNQSPEEEDAQGWLGSLHQACQDADSSQQRPTFPTDAPRLRLDYILASQGRFTSCRIDTSSACQLASDHFPVIANWSP